MATQRNEDLDNEIEALESIYPDKLQIISTDPHYIISIQLDGQPPKEIDTLIFCTLYFEHTPDYPEEAPIYEVKNNEGLSDLQLQELKSVLESTIEENLGMPMIFNLISETQEKLDYFAEHLSLAKDEEATRLRKEEEENESRKRIGTAVTVETFVKWKMKFDEELAAKKEVQKVQVSSKRLTGRQLFLQDDTFDDSDIRLLQEIGDDAVEVDESLFQEMDDLDIDDEN